MSGLVVDGVSAPDGQQPFTQHSTLNPQLPYKKGSVGLVIGVFQFKLLPALPFRGWRGDTMTEVWACFADDDSS